MDIEQITFGIEIETTLPAGCGIRIGGYGVSNATDCPQVPGWKASHDGSIRATGGRIACEFISPVFRGSAGFTQLLADLAAIKALGATVNPSCGLHIHVGFDKTNVAASDRLATLVANFEKAIYASTGTKSRERGNWCHSLQRYGSLPAAMQTARRSRYHVANFATEHPTVEFRAFAATLNVAKIVGHLRMCVGLVERAMVAKKATNWTAKPVAPTSPIKRSGDGQTALTRLFYQLGWTKGRTDHTYGNLSAPRCPTFRAVKRKLMSLARKYDAQR